MRVLAVMMATVIVRISALSVLSCLFFCHSLKLNDYQNDYYSNTQVTRTCTYINMYKYYVNKKRNINTYRFLRIVKRLDFKIASLHNLEKSWQTTTYGANVTSCLFLQIEFCCNTFLTVCVLGMTALDAQGQS